MKALLPALLLVTGNLLAAEPLRLIKQAQKAPSPPWAAGDERGMANAIGPPIWPIISTRNERPRIMPIAERPK